MNTLVSKIITLPSTSTERRSTRFVLLWAIFLQCIWTCSSLNLLRRNDKQDAPEDAVRSSAVSVPLHYHGGSYHAKLSIGKGSSKQEDQHKLVILDTGSHFTAFPCQACKDCGRQHFGKENFYDPDKSETSGVVGCSDCRWPQSRCDYITKQKEGRQGKCQMKQRYMEGSSWTAYEIEDQVSLAGGKNVDVINGDEDTVKSVPFVFGCQIEETGLFKTQYADGIMGLTMHPNSIIDSFATSDVIGQKSFSLCLHDAGRHLTSSTVPDSTTRRRLVMIPSFYSNTKNITTSDTSTELHNEAEEVDDTTRRRLGHKEDNQLQPGGIFTIGRSSQTQLSHHLQPMKYTPLVRDYGFYSVFVVALQVGTTVIYDMASGSEGVRGKTAKNEEQREIMNGFNGGKGTIIDSGTTDTYLPAALTDVFEAAWEESCLSLGLSYSNSAIDLSMDAFALLPSITITLKGGLKWVIEPKAYFEPSKDLKVKIDENGNWNGKRRFNNRIYLDEGQGATIGSNFMLNHDILFDETNQRIGIAKSNCEYDASLGEN